MRRRSTIYILSLALLSSVLASLSFAQQASKIGMINSQRVLENSKEGKRVIAQLQEKDNKIQSDLAKLDDEIRSLETRLNTQRLTLSEESILQLSSDLDRKRTDRKRRAEDSFKELQALQIRLFNKVQNELLPIIEQIGRDKGFDIIFDLSKSGAVYFNPVLEITDEVIKRYDASKTGSK
ncbi:MAG: OmpH family outer membrane protein [Candidatus Aminicenantaceae bacterium]